MRLRLPCWMRRVQSHFFLLLLVTTVTTLPLLLLWIPSWGYYYCVFRFGCSGVCCVCVCARAPPEIQVLQCMLWFPYPKRGLGIVDQLLYNV